MRKTKSETIIGLLNKIYYISKYPEIKDFVSVEPTTYLSTLNSFSSVINTKKALDNIESGTVTTIVDNVISRVVTRQHSHCTTIHVFIYIN